MLKSLLETTSALWKIYAELLKTNPVIAGMMTLYVTGVATYVFKSVPARIFNYLKSQITVSVAIHNENALFHYFTGFLEKGDKVFRCKSFIAALQHNNEGMPIASVSIGNGNHLFFHKHRPFWLSRVEKDVNNTTERKESIYITTFGWKPGKVREMLQEVLPKKKNDDVTWLYSFTDTHWVAMHHKVSRKIDSVVMTDSNEKKLKEHITQYLNSKEWYRKHNIPWRTGIILEGPPGTGKSTLSLALCGEFNFNLFIANLSTMSDEKIVTMFKSLPPKSILLIEDIDSFSVTNRRKKKTKQTKEELLKIYQAAQKAASPKALKSGGMGKPTVAAPKAPEEDSDHISLFSSLSGLLNAIDGIASTEDRILVATTNHIERLDPALIRPGRFELILKIDNLDDETMRKMFKKFYPNFQVPANLKLRPGISPVEFQTIAIGNKNSPKVLVDFCENGVPNGLS